MYCTNCGRQLEEEARYCSACGNARRTLGTPSGVKSLSRPREGKKIAGVCAGVARYLEVDVTVVRILWILVTILPPVPGIVAYIVCWIAMPRDPEPISTQSPVIPKVARESSPRE